MSMSRFPIAARVTGLPTHFFVELVKRAEAAIAAGRDVINLGRGNPDRPTPPHVVAALQQAAADPANHGYPPFSGLAALRRAVAGWYLRRFGVRLDSDRQVAVLIGAKVGLVEISLCLLEPGDVCLVPDPGYPDYWSGIAMAGGRMAFMPLRAENRFLPDLGAIEPAVAGAARLMFLNYPCNPTAVTAPPEFFAEVVRFADRYRVAVAHDLAYGDLVFDGQPARSFLSTPGALEVGVEFGTFSKTYNMAGWRIGWAAGNEELIGALVRIQDHLHVSQFPAIQQAAIAALEGPQDCVAELVALYQRRRDRLVEAAARAGWRIPAPQGTFYAWAPVPRGYTSQSFADLLLDRADVVVAPGAGFGPSGDGYVRLSLATDEARLVEAMERAARVI